MLSSMERFLNINLRKRPRYQCFIFLKLLKYLVIAIMMHDPQIRERHYSFSINDVRRQSYRQSCIFCLSLWQFGGQIPLKVTVGDDAEVRWHFRTPGSKSSLNINTVGSSEQLNVLRYNMKYHIITA